MIESGILYKKGEVSTAGKKPTRGRKKVLIDINPNYKFTFGVVVDRGVVSVGLSNLNGEVLGKRSERLPDLFDVGRMLDSIINHVRDIKAVSYTHLDVYKRQGNDTGQLVGFSSAQH